MNNLLFILWEFMYRFLMLWILQVTVARLATGWGTEDLKPIYFMGVTEAFLFYVFSHALPTQDKTTKSVSFYSSHKHSPK